MNTPHPATFKNGLVLCMFFLGCHANEKGHDHAVEHPKGHDHHKEDHGHGDLPVLHITRWSKYFELFAEHPAAVVNTPTELILHLTVLKNFRGLENAEVSLELSGAAQIQAQAQKTTTPGIFRLQFVPPKPGLYRAQLSIRGTISEQFDPFEFKVFENVAQAEQAKTPESRGIMFLKEQQWRVPFATAFTQRETLVASIEVAGSVTTPPGHLAEVGAPIAGRLISPRQGLAFPGAIIRKGQLLATLAPAPGSPEDTARASLAVTTAKARVASATAALARAERLIRQQAISQRELEDARREVTVAEESLHTAHAAQKMFSHAIEGSGEGVWRLVAPIDGILTEIAAKPGATVAPGTILFRIINTRAVWIRARVPEQDAARLRSDRDASFQIAGLDTEFAIRLTGQESNAALISVGQTVDAISRTVEILYALRDPDPRLRIGGLVRVHVPTGEDFSGVVVPHSAIIDDDGREIVYVQIDGEHFEERQVRTGPRQGTRIAVEQGLIGEERIVTQGAHIIRLASRTGSSGTHGHMH